MPASFSRGAGEGQIFCYAECMKQFTRLIRLLEITRSQPQYGYALSGIPKGELSDLAQHHYLVTMIAWTLARAAKRAGSSISVEAVLEHALVHDLGELFGGDIAMPYAKANPPARTAAKEFERLNQQHLATFFGEDEAYFDGLSGEVLDAHRNEALIAKIADYIEVTHYKLYVRRLSPGDLIMAGKKVNEMLANLTDRVAADAISQLIASWAEDLFVPQEDIFEAAKSS